MSSGLSSAAKGGEGGSAKKSKVLLSAFLIFLLYDSQLNCFRN